MVEKGYAHPDRLAGKGGSAGGLLIGAVANQAPSLFRALHGQVPFVDVLTTMLDPSLPLTAGEWEEWGDPIRDPQAYAYLKAYSPYDNVGEHAYPALLVTTEPARHPRLRHRAGQVGGPASRPRDQRPRPRPGAAADVDDRRAPGAVRPVRRAGGRRPGSSRSLLDLVAQRDGLGPGRVASRDVVDRWST
jgi:hypothetical protein